MLSATVSTKRSNVRMSVWMRNASSWRFLICSSFVVSFFTFLNVTTGEETVVVLIPTLCKEKLLCLGQSSQLAQKARIEIILHFTEYHATTGGIYSNKN